MYHLSSSYTLCTAGTAAAAGGAASTNLAASGTGLSGRTSASQASPKLSELTPEETEDLFEDFIKKFEKSYADESDKSMRFEIFKRNLKRIDEVLY